MNRGQNFHCDQLSPRTSRKTTGISLYPATHSAASWLSAFLRQTVKAKSFGPESKETSIGPLLRES